MRTPSDIDGASIVLRLPHFHLVGDELFFMISRRAHVKLSPAEEAMWQALGNESDVAVLQEQFGDDTRGMIARFVDLGVCELAQARFPEGRRRIIVFEPHSDDAVLSVGGTMWQRRHECEFIVATIGSQSNFTSYYDLDREYFEVDRISSLRHAEGALFVRMLGGQYLALDLPEAALRYKGGNWTLEWYRRHKEAVSAFIAHHSGSAEQNEWAEAIRKVLQDLKAAEVWFPLGSRHTDHQLTRDAALVLLLQEPSLFVGRKVRFYQDVPYAARFPMFTSTVLSAFERAGAILDPEILSVTEVFADKLRLVSLYGSQFKLNAIRGDVEATAQSEDGSLVERLWHLEAAPRTLLPFLIGMDEPLVRQAAVQLAPWVKRHENAEKIRLLLLVPAGRWEEDIRFLLETFPKASFDAYVSDAASAEVSEFSSSRVHVTQVAAGTRPWLFLALRLMFMRPSPTLFVAGEKRLSESRLLSRFWFMSSSVILPTFDHLQAALKLLKSEAPKL